MALSVYDVYGHLPKRKIDEVIEFNANYPRDRQDDNDLVYLKKLNDDADLLMPVNSDGRRINDIDAMNDITNPLARDILISRMKSNGSQPFDNYGLSDEEIANNVVPKDSTFSDTYNMVNELNEYVNEGAELDKINEQPIEPIQDINPITD